MGREKRNILDVGTWPDVEVTEDNGRYTEMATVPVLSFLVERAVHGSRPVVVASGGGSMSRLMFYNSISNEQTHVTGDLPTHTALQMRDVWRTLSAWLPVTRVAPTKNVRSAATRQQAELDVARKGLRARHELSQSDLCGLGFPVVGPSEGRASNRIDASSPMGAVDALLETGGPSPGRHAMAEDLRERLGNAQIESLRARGYALSARDKLRAGLTVESAQSAFEDIARAAQAEREVSMSGECPTCEPVLKTVWEAVHAFTGLDAPAAQKGLAIDRGITQTGAVIMHHTLQGAPTDFADSIDEAQALAEREQRAVLVFSEEGARLLLMRHGFFDEEQEAALERVRDAYESIAEANRPLQPQQQSEASDDLSM